MKRGPSAKFLQSLTAICACRGESLGHNQELMLKETYSASRQTNSAEQNRFKLLIETIVDSREGSEAYDRQFNFLTPAPSDHSDPSTVFGWSNPRRQFSKSSGWVALREKRRC